VTRGCASRDDEAVPDGAVLDEEVEGGLQLGDAAAGKPSVLKAFRSVAAQTSSTSTPSVCPTHSVYASKWSRTCWLTATMAPCHAATNPG